MASKRPGPQTTFGRPGNGRLRYQRPGAETLGEEARIDSSLETKAAAGTGQQPPRSIPQQKASSRLPQPLSHRRPQVRGSVDSTSNLDAGRRDGDGPSSSTAASSRLPTPSSKPRNLLRRRRSGLSHDAGSTRSHSRNDSAGASSPDLSCPRSQIPLDSSVALDLDRELTQSPTEIQIAQQVELPRTKAQAVTIYPELDRYRNVKPPAADGSPGANAPHPIATHDLPPPTPLFSGTSSQVSGFSGSPSTRWSESPGPGPYSRDTTPTSISSQSPGLVAPIRIPPPGSRTRQVDSSLARAPITRRRTGSTSDEGDPIGVDLQGLAPVRELSTSSSSNSTVRAGGNSKEKKGDKEQLQLPPKPPPRKSSQKFKKSLSEESSHSQPPDEAQQSRAVSDPSEKTLSDSPPRSVQNKQPAAHSKPTPPVRPSRDGLIELPTQLGQPIPVIQSNLSATSLTQKRQSNSNYLSQQPPTREPTPAPAPAISGNAAAVSQKEPGKPGRTPSPGVSTLRTRFGIFGRRTRTIPEPGRQEKKERPARKGPAAGTGHEGYGRLGSVRRRSSIANMARAIPGTTSSQDSLSSIHSYDTFLRDRMAPVIIAGGEVVENRNTSAELTRTESNQSSTCRRPSIESRDSAQVSPSSREASHRTLWPSPFPREVTHAASRSSRRPSESSESEAVVTGPPLAFRRSMQRFAPGGQETPRLPSPVATRPRIVSPSTTSVDGSIMSDDSVLDRSATPAAASKEPSRLATISGPKKLVKQVRSPRKWNLFGRSQNKPSAEKKTETTKTVAATVKVVQSKPVPFYAIMDPSEQEDAEPLNLEEVLRQARGVTASEQPPLGDAQIRRPSVTQDPAPTRPDNSQCDLQSFKIPEPAVTGPITLPGPSVTEPKAACVPVPQPDEQQPRPRHPSGRPSRLPQVGRIPKVVSARAERISPKSFSRPFHRLSTQTPQIKLNLNDADSVARGPSPPKLSGPEPTVEDSNASALIYGIPRLPPPVSGQPGQEFLSFSPRKDSQSTTTTTSSSSGGFLSYANATAIVPDPDAPLAEDEIWDEYNDLLGDDTLKLSTVEGPCGQKPLQLEASGQSDHGASIEPALESPTLCPPPLPNLVQTLRSGMDHTSSSTCGPDIVEEAKPMLESGPNPADPAVAPAPSRDTGEQAQDSQAEEPGLVHPSEPSSGLPTRQSDASGSSQGSDDNSPLSQVNLRVGSMTVSKWLTFGHVLFSPVRDELITDAGSLKRPSILVIDGLGNDDWSFFAAETYPAATFFNLSPRAPLAAEHRSESTFPLTPPNHHQVQYKSHTDKFPFGAHSFTAVVFRFPAAAPEGHYRNIISEARRVLKPGGYLEMSILDVDLNNMGNRCRRTVRRLKERIHARAPDISLAPASDLILRLIGRRGFTDIKTCRVGVPVASSIARSSVIEPGTGGKRSSVTASAGQGPSRPKKKDQRSLFEMMKDEGPVADESIVKSVAKIGRWWYSRCYESAAGPPGLSAGSTTGSRASSMWNDKALLAECQEWGTSLKLMVCHARAPDGRARVASI